MAICEADSARLTPSDLELAAHDYLIASLATTPRDCADIVGVLIDRTHQARVLAQIDEFVQSGEPHQIVTVNVDFLNITHQDPSFVRVLNQAAVSVPDGMPLLWVSRLVGQRLPERITGTDLLLGSAALAARRGYSIFLLGAAPGVADEAGAVLQARYPGLQIAGAYSPPECGDFTPEENARILAQVRAARPDMLFVALGTPKQEKWIYANLQELGVPVCVGVGGVFNVIPGRIPRAPEPLQRAGLEWLFRLALEPRRLWRRYLIDDTRALARAVAYAARRRAPAVAPAAQATLASAAAPHPRLNEAPDWRLTGREAAVAPVQTSAGQDA